MDKLCNYLISEESGQGMVEYGLIVGLISVVVIALLTSIGTNLTNHFAKIENALKPK